MARWPLPTIAPGNLGKEHSPGAGRQLPNSPSTQSQAPHTGCHTPCNRKLLRGRRHSRARRATRRWENSVAPKRRGLPGRQATYIVPGDSLSRKYSLFPPRTDRAQQNESLRSHIVPAVCGLRQPGFRLWREEPTWRQRWHRAPGHSPVSILPLKVFRWQYRAFRSFLSAHPLRGAEEISARLQLFCGRDILVEHGQNLCGDGTMAEPGPVTQSFIEISWNVFNV